ncbi:CIA30 family protein [Hyunsoonleella flava]|uniref:CIA30 family protein n=1 Tax=Hyunsoonleella flava TaxID=2527939 RepID=A0A4Q9FIH4_9FLAO|nr:CIA30 family protein [Hyunsoonleella flava]TBN04902.1 CIA30 family protein [Hyunsoonleella flava]
MQTQAIFDFNKNSNIENWVIVDDVVMGGKSSGDFKLDADGNGMFYGTISLENNGGFSSVRYRGKTESTKGYSKIVLRLKGDGKRYQFRVKETIEQRHSYVNYFTTSGDWETIKIPLKDLFPKFRGRTLDIPNFSGDTIAELGFLFGNKKAEEFKLLIDTIVLQ